MLAKLLLGKNEPGSDLGIVRSPAAMANAAELSLLSDPTGPTENARSPADETDRPVAKTAERKIDQIFIFSFHFLCRGNLRAR